MRTILQRLSVTLVLMLLCLLTVAAEEVTVGNLKYTLNTSDHTASVSGYVGGNYVKVVKIPKTIISNGVEYKVTSLVESCFDSCSSLISVTIPESVTSLPDFCFNNCRNLAKINIPFGVKSFGACCFSDCDSLTSITIPGSVTSLGMSCFERCI